MVSVSPSLASASMPGFFCERHADPGGLQRQTHCDHVVRAVHPDWGAGGRAQLVRTADVIDMRMRDHDCFHLQLVPLQDGLDFGDVRARIDYHCFSRHLVAEDRAVTVEDTNRKYFVDHSSLSYDHMDYVLPYLARYLHIASAITLMGGMIFAAIAWLPALRTAGADGQSMSDAIAARFRPWFAAAIAGLLLSGFYNYMRHAAAKDVPTMYHMVFGMKFLLALHVFAVGWLSLGRGNPKRGRQISGVVISGLVIIGLSAWMRFLALGSHIVMTYGPPIK